MAPTAPAGCSSTTGSLRIKGPVIHTGPGSVTSAYKPEDWNRVPRHGVKPDGKPAMIMPSEDYNRLPTPTSWRWWRTPHPPPAGGGAAEITLPLPVRALYGAGAIEDAADKIDHSPPVQQPVAEASR